MIMNGRKTDTILTRQINRKCISRLDDETRNSWFQISGHAPGIICISYIYSKLFYIRWFRTSSHPYKKLCLALYYIQFSMSIICTIKRLKPVFLACAFILGQKKTCFSLIIVHFMLAASCL